MVKASVASTKELSSSLIRLVGIVHLAGQPHSIESAMRESPIDEIVSQPFAPLDVEATAEVISKDARQHADRGYSRRN